eukprot:TRINITY_DN4905_c0_g1_i2.p1 TRINITY_DN4905_c0_g1~~TRINITY_DN4905_c0_g1_i2.p1  ORF type:complete len:379 (+),score=58.21 TRINITY_DN4905_c0_g1_i2:61-1197(+)
MATLEISKIPFRFQKLSVSVAPEPPLRSFDNEQRVSVAELEREEAPPSPLTEAPRRRFSFNDAEDYQLAHSLNDEAISRLALLVAEKSREEALLTARGTGQLNFIEKFETGNDRGTVRFVCISDTHTHHNRMAPLPPGDVLIHAGDFSFTGTPSEIADFNSWLGRQPFKIKIVIAGNHDITLHRQFYDRNWKRWHKTRQDFVDCRKILTNCIYLQDEAVCVDGLVVWGTPWQPWFLNWAFNLNRGQEIAQRWELIPSRTDVLVVHGPAYGHGDKIANGEHVGCKDLLSAIQRIKPQAVVCGHVHEGYGVTMEGPTKMINCCTCTEDYKPLNPPIVFELKKPNQNPPVAQLVQFWQARRASPKSSPTQVRRMRTSSLLL